MQIGEGSFYDNSSKELIKLPPDITLKSNENSMKFIVEAVYPSLMKKYSDLVYLQERTILTPKNETVHQLNEFIIDLILGDLVTYFSLDTICKSTINVNDEDLLYTIEFLNSFKFAGVPNHDIRLKVGAPVMLLRNFNQTEELCNGIRLIVRHLGR